MRMVTRAKTPPNRPDDDAPWWEDWIDLGVGD